MKSTMNPENNSLQSSIRSKQHARGTLGIKRRQCHGGCKHLKGPWKRIWMGGVVWLPPHAKVMEIPGDRVEGGYAKV
jgi:hypothetical protein